MTRLNILFVLLFIVPELTLSQSTGDIILNIEGIQHHNGTLRVALFSENDHFLKEPSYSMEVKAAERNTVTLRFRNIPYGTYAISIYHDLDEDEKLNTNLIGIPTEPVGFSNDHRPKFGPPKFNGAKFFLDSPAQTQTVTLYTY
jgi:uncharacterized protein (DUF2141 family)